MSKSKGNVIDPLLLMDKYGTDALRAALIFGTKEGGDVSLSEDKVKGMRNFANKIWNIGRFLEMNGNYVIASEAKQSQNKIATSPTAPRNDITKILIDLEKETKELKKDTCLI